MLDYGGGWIWGGIQTSEGRDVFQELLDLGFVDQTVDPLAPFVSVSPGGAGPRSL